MSMSRSDYVIFGAKIETDKDLFGDELLPMTEGHVDAPFFILSDVTSGNYIVAGKVLLKSDEYEGFELSEITEDMLKPDHVMQDSIIKTFDLDPKTKFSLYIVSRFW